MNNRFVSKKFQKGELIEQVRRELGPIATPAALEFVTGQPKTRSGKILRRVIKARELGVEPGDLPTIEAKLCASWL